MGKYFSCSRKVPTCLPAGRNAAAAPDAIKASALAWHVIAAPALPTGRQAMRNDGERRFSA
ncbi:hypothetical protein [Daejeonella lutea]|uniref:hypothetical protein n=1 Tax=Daejeonella lutea TaxID=572036 RepID=UPI0009A8EEFD|nr:hypothetical protein [Daejeonella lutea]